MWESSLADSLFYYIGNCSAMDKESPPRFAAAERCTSAKRNFVAKSDRAWRENVL